AARFILVGSEGDGPVEAAAHQIPNVSLVPWQPFGQLPPWLYAADVLLIPPSLDPLRRHGNTVLPIKLFLYLGAGRALLAPRAPPPAPCSRPGRRTPPSSPPTTTTPRWSRRET